MNTRVLICAILALSLFTQTAFANVVHPSAEAFNIQTFQQTADSLKMRYDFNRSAMIKANKAQLEAKYKSTNMGQAGRMLILMLALSGVELVRKQAREAKLSGKTLSEQEYATLAKNAATKVADSGDIWFGIFSDLGIGAVTKKPAEVLASVLKDKVARPLFVNLIQSGIMSIIYFVGFQACAQLWRDARLLLDPQDYDKSEKIWSLGLGAVIDLAHSNTKSDDARISRAMIGNMAKILIFDSELRENWFYNTWRMGLATGRFVTLVSGIITATTIGTTFYPGAGTILGFMFAFTGAMAAAALPPSVNNSISQKLKDARIGIRKFQATNTNWRLQHLVESYKSHSFYWTLQRTHKSIPNALSSLATIREHVATAYIEKVYLSNSNARALIHDLAIAKFSNKPQSTVDQIQRQMDHEIQIRSNALVLLARFYETQYRELESTEIPINTPLEIRQQFEAAKSDIAALYGFFAVFAKSSVNTSLQSTFEVLLQNFYLRTFKEAAIVRIAKQQLANRAS